MFENLKVFEERFEALRGRLYDPSVASDIKSFAQIQKELKTVEPIALKYREYKAAVSEMEELEMLLQGDDRELKELAQEELPDLQGKIETITEELKILLLPKDKNDERNVIVEIRAGTGGEESALFAADLYRMYSLYAVRRGWKTELLGASETELGGYKEISFSLLGESAYSRMKFESGAHRVQRVPETESQGRIHTSACTVAVLPEVDEVEVEIDPKDLQIDTFRSSGAGGQKVNKTSSAIRVTYLPLNMVVECQDERSQYKNKDKALKVLRSRLYELKQSEQDEKLASDRKNQVGSGDRSERIRTYNFPQGRVSDHRIGMTIYRLDEFLGGDMDEIIDGLIAADRAKKMEELIDKETE